MSNRRGCLFIALGVIVFWGLMALGGFALYDLIN